MRQCPDSVAAYHEALSLHGDVQEKGFDPGSKQPFDKALAENWGVRVKLGLFGDSQ